MAAARRASTRGVHAGAGEGDPRQRQRPSTEPIHDTRDVDADGVPARSTGRAIATISVCWSSFTVAVGSSATSTPTTTCAASWPTAAVTRAERRLPAGTRAPVPGCVDDASRRPGGRTPTRHRSVATPDRLAIGGDSAGANLSIVVCHLAPVPLRYQLLVYPATDLTLQLRQPRRERHRARPHRRRGMAWFIDHYAGGDHEALDDPRLSPTSPTIRPSPRRRRRW